jgi:cobalamin biosynthesis Mg chelatase CobN
MTESSVPSATQAISDAATTALPTDDPIDHGYFVPQGTRDNWTQIVRDQSQTRGVDPDTVRGELVQQFLDAHARQPLDGYDHLAGWLADADLSALTGPTGMQVLTARMLESARRDPSRAVIGDQALVETAVAAQTAADEAAAASLVAPGGDPSSGLLPNPGPLPVPEGTTSADPAVAEQQQAAATQAEPGDGSVTGTTTPAGEPDGGAAPPASTDTASSTDTSSSSTPSSSSSSGKSSKSSSSGGSGSDSSS